MTCRPLVGAALLFLAVPGSPGAADPSPADADFARRARAIHDRILILDSHVDIRPGYATPELDPGTETALKVDLPKMVRGGLDAVFLAVFVPQTDSLCDAGYASAYEKAMVKFRAIHRLTDTLYVDRCQLAARADQVKTIVRHGRRAIMIGVENGYPLGEDLGNLRQFYDLGARYVTLAHTGNNQICDTSNPVHQPLHHGLSEFGRAVVVEMNRLGMMVDLSHVSVESFADVLRQTRAPVIASHSGCHALNPVDRNLTDDQLRALAANGGVLQVVALGVYLKPEGAGLTDFVDHLDHAVQVAGIDHVGIGSDFDGGGGIPGFSDASEAPNVTAELLRRGYSEKQIRKIWGENLLRVWRQVERVAARKASRR